MKIGPVQNNDLIIKRAVQSDIAEITKLFYDTIQSVNFKDYSKEQIDDWSSWHTDFDKWGEKIAEQFFLIALLNNKVVGFSSLATDGYLDFMFVHKDFQGKGIAKQLLKKIENKAKEQNNSIIYSDVSITAKPFFEKNGFEIVKQQLKKSRLLELINFRMEKKVI